MTEPELKQLIFERMKAADLLHYLSEGEQQCFDFPEGFFVEVVVKDGSKLPAVRNIMDSIRAELEQQGVPLDPVVRALWDVKDVQYVGVPVDPESGGPKVALRFRARLRSGERQAEVKVDVSPSAQAEVRSRLGADEETLKKVVRDFLALQLSTGGTSYWNPLDDDHLEMEEMAAAYVIDHRPMRVG